LTLAILVSDRQAYSLFGKETFRRDTISQFLKPDPEVLNKPGGKKEIDDKKSQRGS